MRQVSRRRRIGVLGTAAVVVAAGLTAVTTVTHLVPPADAAPSATMAWPLTLDGNPDTPAVDAVNIVDTTPPDNAALVTYDLIPGLTATYTVDTLDAGNSVAQQSYGVINNDPNVDALQEPEPPDSTPYFVSSLTGAANVQIAGGYSFNRPVATPVFHAVNLDRSVVDIGLGPQWGTPVVESALEVAAFSLNNVRNAQSGPGCTPQGGGAPAGEGCGSIPITNGGAAVQTFGLSDLTTFVGPAADDWRWAVSVPAIPVSASFAAGTISAGDTTQLTFTLTNAANHPTVSPLDFTMNLPAGLAIGPGVNGANIDCGNMPSISDGASGPLGPGDIDVRGSNLSLAPGASCQITVNVTAANVGVYTLTPSDPGVSASDVANPIFGAGDSLRVLGTPFPCASATSTVYLGHGAATQLDQVDFTPPGGFTNVPIGPAAVAYNAMGLNPVDNFIYAVRFVPGLPLDPANGNVVVIDSTGTVTDLGDTTPALDIQNSGTFGSDGTWYMPDPTDGGDLHRVNVTTMTDSPIPINAVTIPPPDVAFVGGMLWGQLQNVADPDQPVGSYLVRINPANGVTSYFPTTGLGLFPDNVSAGAAWTFGNGDLGIQDNATGTIYRIRITDPSGMAPTFQLMDTRLGPSAADNNDGTSCLGEPANLSVTKTVDPSPVAPGAPMTWTVTVTNNGPGDSSGFEFTDVVQGNVTNLASATPGCSVAGNQVTCTGAPLTAGQSTQIVYTADAPVDPGPFDNTASVLGNEPDPTSGDNAATATSIVLGPDLAITKTAPEVAPATSLVTWELRVTNNGPGVAGNVGVIDVVPDGVIDVALVAPVPAGCAVNGNTVQCTIPSIAEGETVVIRISGRPTKEAKPAVVNTATVTGAGDPNPDNNTASSTTKVRNPPSDVCLEPDVDGDGRPYEDHNHEVHSHSDERLHDHRHRKCDPERPHLHYGAPGNN